MMRYYFITICIALLVGVGGYIMGAKSGGQLGSLGIGHPSRYVKISPLLQDQVYTVNGVITSHEGQSVTIKSAATTDTLTLAKDVKLDVPGMTSKGQLVPSQTVTDIQLNKQALVYLKVLNGEFEVTEITYIPLLSTNPVSLSASSSAKPKTSSK